MSVASAQHLVVEDLAVRWCAAVALGVMFIGHQTGRAVATDEGLEKGCFSSWWPPRSRGIRGGKPMADRLHGGASRWRRPMISSVAVLGPRSHFETDGRRLLESQRVVAGGQISGLGRPAETLPGDGPARSCCA